MNQDKPLVSIITTSYNYGRYIAQTIQSVLDQTYAFWELIISDDGSSDNSLEVIRSFRDSRIHVIASPENRGAGTAYRAAYECCKGTYLVSLDSDDAMVSERLARQVAYFEEHPDVDILGTYVRVIDADGQESDRLNRITEWYNVAIDLNNPASWLGQNRLCHSSVMIKKSLHDRVGMIDNRLLAIPDYEFWVRCLAAAAKFAVLPEPLTIYRDHGLGATTRFSHRSAQEQIMLFCEHIRPLLLHLGRYDLLERGIEQLIESDSFQALPLESRARGLELLTNPEYTSQGYDKLLASFNHPPNEQSRLIATLLASKHDQRRWLEQQVSNWQLVATQQTATIEEMRNWIALQEQGIAWSAEIEAARDYHAAQVERWRTLAEERAAWSAQLEQARSYHAAQVERWQEAAAAQAAQIRLLEERLGRIEEQLGSLSAERDLLQTERDQLLRESLFDRFKRQLRAWRAARATHKSGARASGSQ